MEAELASALKAQAHEQGVRLSEYLRAILRAGAGVCDLRESGYREGRLLGYSEVREKIDTAYESVPSSLQGSKPSP